MAQETKNYVIAFYPINKFDRQEFDYCETDEIMKKLATIKDDVILAQLNGARDIVEDFVECFNDGEEFLSDCEKRFVIENLTNIVNVSDFGDNVWDFINANWAVGLDVDLTKATLGIRYDENTEGCLGIRYDEDTEDEELQSPNTNGVLITSTKEVHGIPTAEVILNEIISITKNGKVPVMLKKDERGSYVLYYGDNNKKTFTERKVIGF